MKRMAKPVFVSSLYLILSLTPIHKARSCKNKSRRRAAKTKRTNVLSLRRESNKKSTPCDVSLQCLLIIRADIFARKPVSHGGSRWLAATRFCLQESKARCLIIFVFTQGCTAASKALSRRAWLKRKSLLVGMDYRFYFCFCLST
jgi:hypothetical protein